jgi:hypothetical protein
MTGKGGRYLTARCPRGIRHVLNPATITNMPAAKERPEVFPLVAVLRLLPENCVRGLGFEKQTFIGSPTWLSSTSRWGCGYRCDGTASESSVGRFNTADPSNANVEYSNPASLNLYSYVNGDPVNANDPNGLQACFPSDPTCSPGDTFDQWGGDNNWDYERPWSLWSPDTWTQNPTTGAFLQNGYGALAIPMGGIIPPLWGTGATPAIWLCVANPACLTTVAVSVVVVGVVAYAVYEYRKSPPPGVGRPKTGMPPGTVPIDQAGLNKDQVHDVKDGVLAGPRDWVGISPDGDVWTGGSSGEAVNHGPWKGYTH